MTKQSWLKSRETWSKYVKDKGLNWCFKNLVLNRSKRNAFLLLFSSWFGALELFGPYSRLINNYIDLEQMQKAKKKTRGGKQSYKVFIQRMNLKDGIPRAKNCDLLNFWKYDICYKHRKHKLCSNVQHLISIIRQSNFELSWESTPIAETSLCKTWLLPWSLIDSLINYPSANKAK